MKKYTDSACFLAGRFHLGCLDCEGLGPMHLAVSPIAALLKGWKVLLFFMCARVTELGLCVFAKLGSRNT